MAPISKSLDEAVGKLSAMNESAIGQLAGNFADRLQGATGEHMNRMADTLADLRTSLEGMNRRMEESGSGLVEKIGRSVEDMRTAISTMTAALGEMASRASQGVEDGGAAMTRQIEHATESLDITSRQISGVLKQAADSIQAASERSAVRIEETVGTITRGLEVQSAGIGERVAAAAMAASEESRIKVISAGSDLAHMLSGIGQQLTDASTRMHESINCVVHEMTGIERSIGRHAAVIGQLSKATQEAETAMQGTARSMREAGAPLAETSRQIAEATRRISRSAGQTENLGVMLDFAKDED